MSSSSCSNLKLELADHIYQYLCHEAQHSDLPEAARESLTAASECIEQAYKLNHTNHNINSSSSSNNNNNLNNNNSSNTKHHQQQIDCSSRSVTTSSSSAAASSSSSSAAAAALASATAAATTTTATSSSSSPILPDELLRIFTRHKEFLAQSKDSTINHHHHHHHHHLHHSSTSSSASNQKQQQQTDQQQQQQQQQNESGAGTSGPPKRRRRLIPGIHRSSSIGVSVHQKNFKQKLIALIKKFRTDGSHFDSEEQYREALERELMKAAAGRGSRAIEELLEEEIDVEGESASEQEDWDNISETSTPKPSLRPFFSSTTLDKI